MTAVHAVPDAGPLTRRQHALLRFSARHALAGTGYDRQRLAIWEAFGIGVLRYRQQLMAAVRHPGAEAAEPAEVRRLRRLLDRRAHRGGVHPPETRST
ncbi:DUF3263 domain-containing protein [Klenkia brasiliensis]|uniref:DUF3263 domain-containing protein n=1 Tax=Klenkia brasiliensis TaxID=333142 RepID=A0A1G7YHH8_9ACTN|nr:DUF3263 domain-containing protein [Klenkia brasiliensis]SDG95943.1 Protein of unknown function [Klenkia brasiliensis]